MVTDDERREVARDLRELASDDEEVSDFDLAEALGLGAVSRYGYDPSDVERLADLIEPAPGRTCQMPDRDALLALAGEMDELGRKLEHVGTWVLSWRLGEYAHLIREACGEVVGHE